MVRCLFHTLLMNLERLMNKISHFPKNWHLQLKSTIVCFVRKYDSEYQGQTKYSVVRAYTMKEMLEHALILTNPKEIDTSSDLSINATSGMKEKEQMFTPTTKLVLENIAESTAIAETKITPTTRAKRGLSFTDVDVDSLSERMETEVVAELSSESKKDSTTATSTKASPSNKTCGKVKLNGRFLRSLMYASVN
ncbi:hypothetical protein ACH5RR_023171 [Cinchona calisaya]|uniref:Uncharacterized protein n=1 Tax=Cinchona calisaya TaxID=153742 RepID=A0ABD2Z9W4_9GENT